MNQINLDLLKRCRNIGTSTWSDALDQLGIAGVIQGLTLRSGSGCVAGTALTVKETVSQHNSYPIEAFAVGKFLDLLEPGVILAIAMDGAPVSTFGGLAAQTAVQRGAAGAVIDGACRDLSDIRTMGFWLSSRHVSPTSGKGRVKVEEINAPIMVGGIWIKPQDYIMGDETGIACVSSGRILEVLAVAEELASRDARFAESLRAGDTFSNAADRLRHM